DHWITNCLFIEAAHRARLAPSVVCWGYEVWTPLVANTVVDITAAAERKRLATQAFPSQQAEFDDPRAMLGLNAYRSLHRGRARGLDEDAETVIDARGTTVLTGLIDSHVHPVFGDFTPRQRTVDFIDSGMHGGVTTAISAGEVHLPGRPKDIVGLKALAIVAAKSYANFRPGGVKVHAGAPILELGMSEGD